jgi:myosin-6
MSIGSLRCVVVLRFLFCVFSDLRPFRYTANILLALNPYHTLDLYTAEIVKSYQGKSLGVLPPHTYAIADKSYRDMRNLQLSQSIMCSGESGAGKTESTKHLLRYLTDSYGGGDDADLESRILAANPLLESFGNAKTTRNHNSSRFGKFIELHFNKGSKVIGAYIEHYLLEKSRIISQMDKERNYQVFYRMIKGSPPEMAGALNLKPTPEAYEYTKHGVTTDVAGLDDVKEFAMMEKSMTDCGLEPTEKSNAFRVTAACLHIGNVVMEESGDGSGVSAATKPTLQGVAAMLGLDVAALEKAMCFKTISIAGTDSDRGLSVEVSTFGKNALAKALYSKLFDWIVERCNKCFPYPKGKSVNYIGILDIAGFEYFQHNSFEQFCINFCNEKLQQFFNERVLKDEQELYVKESIKFKEVEYVDNQDVIDIIEGRPDGILAILDEQSKLPKASDEQFTEKIHIKFKGHFRLQIPRKSKMSYYKKLRDNEGFIVRHFAGAVCYESKDFMDKNNDALTFDMHQMVQTSKDPFTAALFTPKEGEQVPKKGKITLISLGAKFITALNELMLKLNSTRASFVRCIKPNQKFIPKQYTGGEILSQLQCAGMVTVMDLMQGGFPSRTAFKDLYDMYKDSLPPVLAQLDPRTFAKALFKALGLNEADFQFGVSKVFFRPGKFAEFDQIMKGDPDNLARMVEKVMAWLVKQRWKKIAWACVACLKFHAKIRARGDAVTIMQRVVKMHFAKKQHLPRALGLTSLTKLTSQVEGLKETVEKLPKNKEKYLSSVDGPCPILGFTPSFLTLLLRRRSPLIIGVYLVPFLLTSRHSSPLLVLFLLTSRHSSPLLVAFRAPTSCSKPHPTTRVHWGLNASASLPLPWWC